MAVSAAGPGATLEAALEVVGALDASMATGPALVIGAAVTAGCPGTEKVEEDTASVLMSA